NRFYLEVQSAGRPGDEECLHATVALAAELNLPIVATNDVRFISADDFEAHEVRVCIHESFTLEDPRREKRYTEEQYLKTPEEMVTLFSDLPEALANSVEIAKRCSIDIELGKNYLPDFPVPAGMTIAEYFEQASYEGLEKRLTGILDPQAADYAERKQKYLDRLAFE